MDDQTRWLSYVELGQALGIAPASAKRLAIRHNWSKKPGNDGKARVAVPIDRLPVPGDNEERKSRDGDLPLGRLVTSDTETIITALSGHIASLQERVHDLNTRLASTESERDAARVMIESVKANLFEEKMISAVRAANISGLQSTIEAMTTSIKDLSNERDKWHAVSTRNSGFNKMFLYLSKKFYP